MLSIVPKSKASGVDFCGRDENHYIIRSDLSCYMETANLHQGGDLQIHSLHPSCRGGEHYLADDHWFYIIKGNTYRRVSDMVKDADATMFDLHKDFQKGSHYLSTSGRFYVIFQDRGVYRQTNNMSEESEGDYPLEGKVKNGLYYWGTKSNIYFVSPNDKWGVQFQSTSDNLEESAADPNIQSFQEDVINFLPGGLAITRGKAFGKWQLVKRIGNDSNTPITWEQKLNRKLGYTKSKTSSIEHNWKLSASATFQPGALTTAIAKYQFSTSAEYGGTSVNTESEHWEDVTEVEEKISLIVPAYQERYLWQYKLGFGEDDVLFCRDLKSSEDSRPPEEIPLPRTEKK